MSTRVIRSLGGMLRDARTGLGVSLQDVAARARCSSAYVHKLEMNRVRTPSPRVLAGLAEALGLPYDELMRAAAYDAPGEPSRPGRPGVVKRYSNAHIVELLENLLGEVEDLKTMLADGRRPDVRRRS